MIIVTVIVIVIFFPGIDFRFLCWLVVNNHILCSWVKYSWADDMVQVSYYLLRGEVPLSPGRSHKTNNWFSCLQTICNKWTCCVHNQRVRMLGLVKGFNQKINPGKEGWWPDYRKVMFPLNFERVHERAHLRTREPLPPSRWIWVAPAVWTIPLQEQLRSFSAPEQNTSPIRGIIMIEKRSVSYCFYFVVWRHCIWLLTV